MNKEYSLWNLREALEQIEETIRNIQEDKEYGAGDYVVEMSHVYHHINTAWNARNASKSQADECSEENFNHWRLMPENSELLLEL